MDGRLEELVRKQYRYIVPDLAEETYDRLIEFMNSNTELNSVSIVTLKALTKVGKQLCRSYGEKVEDAFWENLYDYNAYGARVLTDKSMPEHESKIKQVKGVKPNYLASHFWMNASDSAFELYRKANKRRDTKKKEKHRTIFMSAGLNALSLLLNADDDNYFDPILRNCKELRRRALYCFNFGGDIRGAEMDYQLVLAEAEVYDHMGEFESTRTNPSSEKIRELELTRLEALEAAAKKAYVVYSSTKRSEKGKWFDRVVDSVTEASLEYLELEKVDEAFAVAGKLGMGNEFAATSDPYPNEKAADLWLKMAEKLEDIDLEKMVEATEKAAITTIIMYFSPVIAKRKKINYIEKAIGLRKIALQQALDLGLDPKPRINSLLVHYQHACDDKPRNARKYQGEIAKYQAMMAEL